MAASVPTYVHMAIKLRVVVPPHPLISHWLAVLRHRSTPSALVTVALEELGRWLTYEATRDWLPHQQEMIETPLATTEGSVINPSVGLLVLPLPPAGLFLWQGGRIVLPNVSLCLEGIPEQISPHDGLMIYTDQIGNDGQLLAALSLLRERHLNHQQLRVITALASSVSLKQLSSCLSDLTIYTACIDPGLGEGGLVSPGFGDPVERLNLRRAASP